ncbi:potassium channel family protein [Yinghuangia soli]|uniref:Potassium channel family protein n=1 Tax=Yinghuangia soli TaxID=2908204 RepID=A0AA41PU80_9ACTN|nr:potassium channel family protein [Yinghuangia soli]MCF2525964.1 potassium channel family protein [Yinghuangia soli]
MGDSEGGSVVRDARAESGPGNRPLRWMALRAACTLALVVLGYYMLPDDFDGESFVVRCLIFAVCVAGLAGLILYLIMREPADSVSARAEGLLLTVMVSLAFFATVYFRLSQDSGQFDGLETKTDGLYFTLVTTATVGYGDIHATGQAARIAVMVHIVFNLVFLGAAGSVALARIKQRRRSGTGSA